MCRPRCSKSSPLLATTVRPPGGSTRERPSASLPPPTPPESASTGRVSVGRSAVAPSAMALPEQIFGRGSDQRLRRDRRFARRKPADVHHWTALVGLPHEQGRRRR